MRSSSLARLGVLAAAASIPVQAAAQTFFNPPVINASMQQATPLNIDHFEDDAPIRLEWSTTVLTADAYEYEITYDRASTETSSATRVTLDDALSAGDNHGTVQSGATLTFQIRPSQILAGRSNDLPSDDVNDTARGADDASRPIVLRVFRSATPFAEGADATFTWTFDYDTRRPDPPTVDSISIGEKRLIVNWTAPSRSSDVARYTVVWAPDVRSSTTGPVVCGKPVKLEASAFSESSDVSSTQTSYAAEEGLENGVCAVVAVRSVDSVGNEGPPSTAHTGTPLEVSDFFERYRANGGTEEGGFCFIATAAYGSYAHPAVRIFRLFRDWVLMPTSVGRSLVALYYESSPPIADRVRADPTLASIVRAVLWPVAALLVLAALAPLALAVWLLARRRRARAAAVASALALCLGLGAPGEASADPVPARAKHTGKVGWGFEVKGGPYLPAMGESDVTGAGFNAFGEAFAGEDGTTSRNPLYTLGLDLQILRGFGTAGVGGTFGFMQFVGKGFYGSGQRSPDTTVFNIAPMSLTAFYRFDWLADEKKIPFVPYVRLGLAYHLWWVTGGTGEIARVPTEPNNPDTDIVGRGGKFGWTGTAGIALLLNVLEPQASRSLYESTGIRGSYIFAELQRWQVDGFGGTGFDFSEDTWNLGLYFEL